MDGLHSDASDKTEDQMLDLLVEIILDKGYKVSADDGEEMMLFGETSRRVIRSRLGETEENKLFLWKDGKYAGMIWLVYGNAPDELVCDHTDNDAIQAVVRQLEFESVFL
mgnify:CR=1 FL=1